MKTTVVKKPKLFIFGIDHALPTAMAMHEDGNVIASHAGSDIDDAIDWLHHHHPELEEKHEVIELDKKLVHAHLYKNAAIKTLGEDVVKAFANNKKLKEKSDEQKGN